MIKTIKYDDNVNLYFNSNEFTVTTTPIEIINEKANHIMNYNADTSLTINVSFTNKCNSNCVYCFRNQRNHEDQVAETIIYDRLKSLISSTTAKEITIMFGVQSEMVMEKEQIFNCIKNSLNYLNYYFVESDFTSFQDFKKAYEFGNISSIDELNESLNSKELYERLLNYTKKHNIICENLLIYNNKYCEWFKYIYRNVSLIRAIYKDYIKYRNIPHVTYCYLSNGTLLTKEFIEELESYSDFEEDTYNGILLSLDGPKEIHDSLRGPGTFDKVMTAIQNIKESKHLKLLSILSTLTNKITNLYDYLLFMKDNLPDNIGMLLTPVRDHPELWFDNKEEMLKLFADFYDHIEDDLNNGHFEMFERYKDTWLFNGIGFIANKIHNIYRCNLWNSIAIDFDGTVHNCNNAYLNVNINKDNTLADKPIRDVMDKYDVDKIDMCKNCWNKYICGGPCYYFYENNKKDQLDMVCSYRKYVTERCIRIIYILNKIQYKK